MRTSWGARSGHNGGLRGTEVLRRLRRLPSSPPYADRHFNFRRGSLNSTPRASCESRCCARVRIGRYDSRYHLPKGTTTTKRQSGNFPTGPTRSPASDSTQVESGWLVARSGDSQRGWLPMCQLEFLPTLCPRRVSKNGQKLVRTGTRVHLSQRPEWSDPSDTKAFQRLGFRWAARVSIPAPWD